MSTRIQLSSLCFSALLLTACGGGGGGGGGGGTGSVQTPVTPPVSTASCDVDSQKAFVQAAAEDWYLWYDEMAAVDPADFASADEFLRALTAPLADDFRDPGFSYLTTVAEDEANFSTGAFIGFGFRFGIDGDGRYLIGDAYEGGPAAEAGFVRGAEMLAVDTGDGYVTMREYEEMGTSLATVFGEPTQGLERGFRMLIDGETVDLRVRKDELDVPPLAAAPRSLARPGLTPVGYIHLRSFTLSAQPELEDAFAEFASQGVTDFVIDLRYNGGGLVQVADQILDLLGGQIADGEVAYRISHNEKRVAENVDYAFVNRSNSVTPLRIAFITSRATASASELLINSLDPVIETVLIGSDTVGKAVGQYAFDQTGCETRLRLVTFETVNGDGFGGFYTGLVDTGRFTLCALRDEFTGAFGSEDEALTAGALAWLNEGACPASIGINDASGGIEGLRRGPPPIAGQDRPDRRSTWVQ